MQVRLSSAPNRVGAVFDLELTYTQVYFEELRVEMYKLPIAVLLSIILTATATLAISHKFSAKSVSPPPPSYGFVQAFAVATFCQNLGDYIYDFATSNGKIPSKFNETNFPTEQENRGRWQLGCKTNYTYLVEKPFSVSALCPYRPNDVHIGYEITCTVNSQIERLIFETPNKSFWPLGKG